MKQHPDITTYVALVQQAVQENTPETALQYATTAYTIAAQHNNTLDYALARLCIAASYTLSAHYEQAIPIYQEVWESIESNADDSIIFWMYVMRIRTYQSIGDWENGFLYSYKGIEAAKEKKADVAHIELSYYISLIFERLGQYSQALSYLDTAIALARNLEESEFLTKSLSLYATILVHALQKVDKAREIYQEVLTIAQRTNNYFLQSVALANLAATHPNPTSDEVRDLYKQALKNARKTRISFAITNNLFVLGEWYKKHQDYRRAKKYFEDILRVAKHSPNDPENYWLGYFSLATMYWSQQQHDFCRTQLQKATECLPEQSYPVERKSTFDLWYRLERACGNNNTALQWLEKAHELEQHITTQQQKEAAKTVLIVAKVDALLHELETERQRTREIHMAKEQQNSMLVSMSIELEQKKKALQKIKQIAANAIEVKKKEEKNIASNERTVKEELKELLYNLGEDEHSWEGFRKNLERMHPLFMKRLMERCPELSPMQIRICSLLRLQLSSKEIAAILHLSKKTIDNHREHIRIKLNIPRSINLTAYILNI